MCRDPNFPWPNVAWRRKKLKDGMPVIDVGDDDNRMAALAFAGVGDLIYDHADGTYRYRHFSRYDASEPSAEEIAKLPWRSFTDMADQDRADFVRAALQVMGSTPQAQLK